MEHMMNDFWFPLETNVMGALPKIADYEQEILGQSGWECEGIMQIFRSETSGIIASYLLSLFFFLGSMHATRIIDFRLLRYAHERRFFFVFYFCLNESRSMVDLKRKVVLEKSPVIIVVKWFRASVNRMKKLTFASLRRR